MRIHALRSQTNVNFKERKWLVLAFISAVLLAPYLIFRVSSYRALQGRLEAIRAAGLPASPADLDAWYLPVPANSNRALAIVEAGKSYLAPKKGSDPRKKLFASGARHPLSPEDIASLKTILDSNQSALSLLHQCADLPETRYPIDLSAGPNTLLPFLAQVKALVELLTLESIFESKQTNMVGAVHSLKAAFAVADSLRNEPILISAYVRLETVHQALEALSRLLSEHQLTQEQFDSLSQSLAVAQESGRRELFRALVGERASDATVFNMSFRELERIGIPGTLDDNISYPELAFRFYQLSGIRQRDFTFYLESMDRFISAADLDFPASLQEFDRAEAEVSNRLAHRWGQLAVMSRNLLIPLGKAALREANSTAMLRCAQAALGIEKFRLAHHGSLPTDLAELAPAYIYKLPTDPYDGTALQFQRSSDKGYKLFAAGAVAANQNYHSPTTTNLSFEVRR